MITAKASDQTYTPEMIYDLYVRETSIIFMFIAALFIFIGFAYERSVLKDLRNYRDGLARQNDQKGEEVDSDVAGLGVLVKALGIIRQGGSDRSDSKLS